MPELEQPHESEFVFNSPLIKRFSADDEIPRNASTFVRYHYTSASALMSILRSQEDNLGCVRFTDARYMNDKSEHLFFVKRLMEFMQENRTSYQFCQEVINSLLLKEHTEDEYISLSVPEINTTHPYFQSSSALRHFLFCLSKQSDSLHMWNYYVRNGNYQGYNIGFKPYIFLKSFDSENSKQLDPFSFFCGNILYTRNSQFKAIKALCDSIENYHEKAGNEQYVFTKCCIHLWQYLNAYGLFFKDESFANEDEYRIVVQVYDHMIDRDRSGYFNPNSQKIKISFYERNGILVPCLEVPVEKKTVTQVTMSPMLERNIATSSIQEFLSLNGYENVKVVQSKIPIRY